MLEQAGLMVSTVSTFILNIFVLSYKLVDRTERVTVDLKALSIIMLLHTKCSVNLY